jgi:hypothetical protein
MVPGSPVLGENRAARQKLKSGGAALLPRTADFPVCCLASRSAGPTRSASELLDRSYYVHLPTIPPAQEPPFFRSAAVPSRSAHLSLSSVERKPEPSCARAPGPGSGVQSAGLAPGNSLLGGRAPGWGRTYLPRWGGTAAPPKHCLCPHSIKRSSRGDAVHPEVVGGFLYRRLPSLPSRGFPNPQAVRTRARPSNPTHHFGRHGR